MKYGVIIALLISLLSLGLWYMDGAWANGEMPTKGLVKVIGLSVLSIFFFILARKFKKAS